MKDLLPKGWNAVRLGECCEIVAGSTPQRIKPEYWGGDIPWVTPKDLGNLDSKILEDTPEKITQAGYESCSTTILPKGSVLFSSRAPIGLIAITGRPMCTNQGFKSFIPGRDVDASFLYWTLKRLTPQIAALGCGTTFKEVSKSVVSEFEIPLPPPDEQRRIADILDKADAVRRKRQEAIRLTDELLRSTFLEMFGDPVRNPKGWEVVELDHLADINSGITKGRKLNGKATTLVPYMCVANVQDGYLDLKNVKEIEATSDEVERFALRNGDLLLTEGGDPDKLGRGTVWRSELPNCIHQNHIFSVRIRNQELIRPEFLSAQIGSSRGKRYFLRSAKQTTGIATINKTQLSAFPCLLPPEALQRRYAEVEKSYYALVLSHKRNSTEIDALFSSLVQRAFRGEL